LPSILDDRCSGSKQRRGEQQRDVFGVDPSRVDQFAAFQVTTRGGPTLIVPPSKSMMVAPLKMVSLTVIVSSGTLPVVDVGQYRNV
jgi:hypothetical protein